MCYLVEQGLAKGTREGSRRLELETGFKERACAFCYPFHSYLQPLSLKIPVLLFALKSPRRGWRCAGTFHFLSLFMAHCEYYFLWHARLNYIFLSVHEPPLSVEVLSLPLPFCFSLVNSMAVVCHTTLTNIYNETLQCESRQLESILLRNSNQWFIDYL